MNVYDKPTNNNRPLKASEIKDGCKNLQRAIAIYKPDHIIAFGKTAAKAITQLGIQFHEMPHPSGLNRKLNDKAYVAEKLKGLEDVLSQPIPLKCESEND